MVVNSLATLGIVATAVAVGGASGNWWLSLLVVGLALVAAAYAGHLAQVRAVDDDVVDDVPEVGAAAVPPPAAAAAEVLT